MTKLPRVSGSECVKVLAKAGFYFKRREWDRLTKEHARKLLGELHRLEDAEPEASHLLVPTWAVVENVETIAGEVPDFLPFRHAVAPFE